MLIMAGFWLDGWLGLDQHGWVVSIRFWAFVWWLLGFMEWLLGYLNIFRQQFYMQVKH